MKTPELVDELCRVAERMGLEVRREPLDEGTAGGLCALGPRIMILVDSALAPDGQADVLAASIVEAHRLDAERFDIESVFILPEVRGLLGSCDPQP